MSLIARSRRILVIGCAGAGKSTLSRGIADALGILHIPMDAAFFWLPDWRLRERSEMRRLIAEAVLGDAWVMDGTSPGTLHLRLPHADAVIWMRLPRWTCLMGIVARRIRYHKRTRPDLPEGCLERIDREFLRYVWNFERTEVPEIVEALDRHGSQIPVIVVKSRRQANALLAKLNPCR